MPKTIKLKNDTYVDSTGVLHNRNILSNILSNKGMCTLYSSTGNNIQIHIPSSWTGVKYTGFNAVRTDNASLYELYNGGVRIKKAGYYCISFVLNVDGQNCDASAVLFVNDVVITLIDTGVINGMVSINHSPLVIYLAQNDVVYAGCRFAYAGNYFSRASRSFLTIIST